MVMTDVHLSGEMPPSPPAVTPTTVAVVATPEPPPTVFPSSSAQPYVPPPSPQSETAEQAQARVKQIEQQVTDYETRLKVPRFSTGG